MAKSEYHIEYNNTCLISGITAYSDILEPNADYGKHGIGLRITDAQAEKLKNWVKPLVAERKKAWGTAPVPSIRDSQDKEGNPQDGKFVKLSWREPTGKAPRLVIFDADGSRLDLTTEPGGGTKLQVKLQAYFSKIPTGTVHCTFQPRAIRIIELGKAQEAFDKDEWNEDCEFEVEEAETFDAEEAEDAEDFL